MDFLLATIINILYSCSCLFYYGYSSILIETNKTLCNISSTESLVRTVNLTGVFVYLFSIILLAFLFMELKNQNNIPLILIFLFLDYVSGTAISYIWYTYIVDLEYCFINYDLLLVQIVLLFTPYLAVVLSLIISLCNNKEHLNVRIEIYESV